MHRLKFFIAVFLIVAAGRSFAQVNDSTSLIQSLITRFADSQKIVYTDRIHEGAYIQSEYALEEKFGKHYVRNEKGKVSRFRFTKQEKRYILDQLKQCMSPCWGDSLFYNSSVISVDSFHAYYKSHNQAKLAIHKMWEDTRYSKDFRLAVIKEIQRRPWLFIFSKPIYLRNNTLFVLYFEPRCGNDCGHSRLLVYRKTTDGWKEWFRVLDGSY